MTSDGDKSTLIETAIITSFIGLTVILSLFPLGVIGINDVATPIEGGIEIVDDYLPDVDDSGPDDVSRPSREQTERHLQTTLNNERIDAGHRPLERNETLDQIARYHATDMAEREYVDLESPEGETVYDWMQRYNYTCERYISASRVSYGAEFVTRISYGKPLYGFGETIRSERELAIKIVDRMTGDLTSDKGLFESYWETIGIGIAATKAGDGHNVYVSIVYC